MQRPIFVLADSDVYFLVRLCRERQTSYVPMFHSRRSKRRDDSETKSYKKLINNTNSLQFTYLNN